MSEPVEYTIHIHDVHAQLVEITLTTDVSPGTQVLHMPRWSPGSYLLREYGRHVRDFGAYAESLDSESLSWRKTAGSTWEVEVPEGVSRLAVRYRLWAHELSVRCNHITDRRAFFNGASTWMVVEGQGGRVCHVGVEAPFKSWKIYTALKHRGSSATPLHQASFVARDADHLMDCPIEMGEHQEIRFQVEGVDHRLVLVGEHRAPVEQLVVDMPKVIKCTKEMFGELPYEEYLTLVMHTDKGRGGLEHKDSTALVFPRNHYSSSEGYEDFMCLFTHEHFHAWNVKRIHPQVLGPFDYNREAYTRALWLMEGTTCYYETLLMQRSGLMSTERMLELFGKRIGEIQQIPGRKVRSLEESSFDAWIKHYRPDASSRNTAISYYLKGEIISWLMDMEIRVQSKGEKSLDDVMRLLWERYGRDEQGFPEDQLREIFEEATGVALRDFFGKYISGVEDPDYAALLGRFGLDIAPKDHNPDRPYLGLSPREVGDRLIVDSVKASSPAQIAGIAPGDELVALDHQKLDRHSLSGLIAGLTPGMEMDIHLFRLGQLRCFKIRFGSYPIERYEITLQDTPSSEALALRQSWLGC